MLVQVEPSSATVIAILVVCLALVFRFEETNGFHDTTNAVATVIDTHATRLRPPAIWPGLMKFVGVLASGLAVAYALIELPDVLSQPDGSPAATMLAALFASAGFWNIATWWVCVPTKGATWLGSIGLSALVCLFGVLLFHFVLQIPMPVLKFLGWSLL